MSQPERSYFISDEDYRIYESIKDDMHELLRLKFKLISRRKASLSTCAMLRSELQRKTDRVVDGLRQQLELVKRAEAELDEKEKAPKPTDAPEFSEARLDIDMRTATILAELDLAQQMPDDALVNSPIHFQPSTPHKGGAQCSGTVDVSRNAVGFHETRNGSMGVSIKFDLTLTMR